MLSAGSSAIELLNYDWSLETRGVQLSFLLILFFKHQMSIDKSGYNMSGQEAEFYPPSQATGAPYSPLPGQGQYAQVQTVQGAYIANPVQGTYALPTYAQPSYSAQPAHFAAQGYAQGGHHNQELTRQRPQGQWADGLCDWPTNLFPSCYCTCCCAHGCWIIGVLKPHLDPYQPSAVCNPYCK